MIGHHVLLGSDEIVSFEYYRSKRKMIDIESNSNLNLNSTRENRLIQLIKLSRKQVEQETVNIFDGICPYF